MSAYAIALLTNRKLVIKMDKSCKLENYYEPNEIDWRFNLENYSNMTKYEFYIFYNLDYIKNQFVKINFLNFETNTDILVIRTGLQLIKHLTINKKHHQKIKSLGFEVSKFNIEYLYKDWYNKLFKLKQTLRKYYDYFLNANLNKTTQLICAQIRIGDINGNQFTSIENSRHYWNFIKENLIKDDIDDYKVFITTDKFFVHEQGIDVFGHEKVLSLPFIGHLDQLSVHNHDMQCEELKRLFLNFELLSKCHKGVVSQSSFGIYGLLRKNDKDFSNFYVYTMPSVLMKQFWKRDQLSFHPFDTSLIYLEDFSFNIKF